MMYAGIETPFIESKEEMKQRKAITEMHNTRLHIWEPGLGLGFGILLIVAIN